MGTMDNVPAIYGDIINFSFSLWVGGSKINNSYERFLYYAFSFICRILCVLLRMFRTLGAKQTERKRKIHIGNNQPRQCKDTFTLNTYHLQM